MSALAGRLRWGVICLLGGAIAGFMAVNLWPGMHLVPAVQAQGNTKTVIANEPHRNDALAVVKILIDGKEAAVGAPTMDDLKWWPDRGFLTGRQREWRVAYRSPSDGNWLKTLSFVLKNRTTKKITAVNIHACLPQNDMKGSDFFFGQLPAAVAYTADGKPLPPTRDAISFNPGQELTFALADSQNQPNLDNLLAKALPLSATSLIYVTFGATLENGLGWAVYEWFKPVPEHHGQSVPTAGPYFPPNHLPGPALNPHNCDN